MTPPDPQRPRYVTGRSPCPYHDGLCAFSEGQQAPAAPGGTS
jgi:hypothetical protein